MLSTIIGIISGLMLGIYIGYLIAGIYIAKALKEALWVVYTITLEINYARNKYTRTKTSWHN